MGRTFLEEEAAKTLTAEGLIFEEQYKFAGHKIDFCVAYDLRDVLLDVNGDAWHRWSKIKACDVVKLNRVLEAGGIPLACWGERMKRNPRCVIDGVAWVAKRRSLPWWDWAVPLSDLSPEARMWAAELLEGRVEA